MNIGFDVDGVLYPWHELVLEYLQRYHDFRGDLEYLFCEYFINQPTLWIQNIIQIPTLYESWMPGPELVETLNFLAQKNSLYYITSVPDEIQRVRENWFYRARIPQQDHIIFVRNGSSKLAKIVEYEIDYYCEDLDKYIQELNGQTNLIVNRKPWNRQWWDKIPTVGSVEEYIRMVTNAVDGYKNTDSL